MSLTIKDVLFKLKNQELNLRKPGWDNKGGRGQILERRLGLTNNQKLTDLIDGELKTFTLKESIAATQLKHCLNEIIIDKVNFNNSLLGKKINRVIYVAWDREGNYKGYRLIDLNTDLKYKTMFEEDFEDISLYIKEQYQNIRDFIL